MRLGPVTFPISVHRSSKLFWAAVLLLAGTAAFPLLSGAGLLNTRGGGDSPFLLQRLHQLVTAVQDGHFPVRWMPDANYGYGYPFYNYYAPLSIYIAAFFRFLGFTFVGAIKAAQLAGFLAAGGGMYYLGRRWFNSSWAGLLAAAAYTFAPFHMVNVYVRGDSLAEFWAMAFYPLLFIAADLLLESPRRPFRIALFALTYAALILSHNISALIFSPFLFLYLLLALPKKFRPINQSTQSPNYPITNYQSPPLLSTLIPLLSSLLLALALSAWFWFPALAEQELAQLEPVTAGYFHYSNHFRGAELVQPSLLFNYDVAGGRAFRMGLVQMLVVAAGTAVLFWAIVRKKWVPFTQAVVILLALVAATLMITPLSRPLWDNLPLLPYTQFPWRFLSVQAFFGALAAGALALLPGRRLIVAVAAVALVLSGLGDLRTDHLYLTDADVTAERLAEYEWFTGNIGSTVSAEYLPAYVQPRPFTAPWLNVGSRPALPQGDSVVEMEPLGLESDRQSWLVSTTGPAATVTLPLLAWPGWRAEIDGAQAESYSAPGSGLLTLVVPEGEHTVDLFLGRTAVRAAAEVVSLAAVFLAALLVGAGGRKRAGRRHIQWAAAVLITLLAAGAALRFWPDPAVFTDTLNWDLEQSGYLHHAPEGILFENGLLLRRYRYSSESIRPGEELVVTLSWEKGNGQTADLALMTPAVQRVDAAPVLAAGTAAAETGQVIYRLAVPENAPAGLYVPRLTVAGARPLTASGQTRGELFLRPVRVLNAAQPAPAGRSVLDVRAVDVLYQAPDVLRVELQWLTGLPLTENYNVSLRLVDDKGLVVAQQDGQPGFGYRPSSGWLPGRWENDWLTLPLPADLTAAGAPLALVARLYDVETEAVVLTRRLGEMVREGGALAFRENVPNFELPEGVTAAEAVFEACIRLEGYRLTQSAGLLELTLYWRALEDGREGFFHFVHLVEPETGRIVAQHDSVPRNNTYPTDQWQRGEIVADGLQITLGDVPPGEYQLYAGLYRNEGSAFPPLPAVDEAGRPLTGNRLLLTTITIPE